MAEDKAIENNEAEAKGKAADALRIVGLGASAGGLRACTEFLEHLPTDTGMAFIVILHLDPSSPSHLGELLGRRTQMSVTTITSKTTLQPDHVYVIAPGTVLELHGDTVTPQERVKTAGTRKPIDAFFEDLAKIKREYAIGVVLSGTGNDGSFGLGEIKRAGGICLVQSPASAEFRGMPQAAIDAQLSENVLKPAQMGAYLADRVGVGRDALPTTRRSEPSDPATFEDTTVAQLDPKSKAFRDILRLLTKRFGVDFQDYRSGTLTRRISRRMTINRVRDYDDYRRLLRENTRELDTLYQDLLIDVTQFYRDSDVWTFLEEELMPDLASDVSENGGLRFWVSACSTGEEVYSLAILVFEALRAAGTEAKVQIFATDVNNRALDVARRGLYPASIAEKVSDERLERYFERHGDYFQVKSRLRESVTFALHNVLVNPPFSRMDLVTCRNLLIYLKSDAQQRALEMLSYALKPCGYLVLGTSESIDGKGLELSIVSKKLRIFRAPKELDHRAQPYSDRRAIPSRLRSNSTAPPMSADRAESSGNERTLERYILSHHAPAAVVVNKSMDILHFYGPTDAYLHPPTGSADLDLLAWLRPGLYAGLQATLERAIARGERGDSDTMRVERNDTTCGVTVRVEPLAAIPGGEGLYLVVFRPATSSESGSESTSDTEGNGRSLVKRLETQLRDARRERTHLIDKLNATSEDYQAHHEELLSLNEELQSSNEELESSKEELQSLNEELLTVNQELAAKNEELSEVNTDLKNLFTSTNIPTIFLDKDLNIRRFTPASTDVMRLVPADVGRAVADIKERFEQRDLTGLLQEVLETGKCNESEVRTNDGKYYNQRILPYRTEEGKITGVSVTFNDITTAREEAIRAQGSREYSDAVIRTVRTALLVLDEDLCVQRVNRFFRECFAAGSAEMEGQNIFELNEGRWDIPGLRELLLRVLPEKGEVIDYELEHDLKDLGCRVLRVNVHAMERSSAKQQILMSMEDVTERRKAERVLKDRGRDLELERARKNEFLAMLGHELRNPLSAISYGLSFLEVAKKPKKIKKTKKMMGRQLQRMTSMLDQLLEMPRVAEGKITLELESLDLSEVARHAIEVLSPQVEERQQHLSVLLPDPGVLIVRGDANRLAQVIENLLINAVKYTQDGGHIEVKLEQKQNNAVFSVCDTGVGIDDDLMPVIFDLFVQASRTLDRAEGGFGLGLPLVKELVELHGGDVSVASEGLDKGSTFTFSIPIDDGLEAPASTHDADSVEASDPDPKEEDDSEPLRILVIDDEADLAELFVRLLQRKGYSVKMAMNGPEGIELVRSFHPRVVLLDLGLPDMDGYEVARRLRDEFGDTPLFIVAVSGYSKESKKLEQAGFDNHLLKPPDMNRLHRWIEALD